MIYFPKSNRFSFKYNCNPSYWNVTKDWKIVHHTIVLGIVITVVIISFRNVCDTYSVKNSVVKILFFTFYNFVILLPSKLSQVVIWNKYKISADFYISNSFQLSGCVSVVEVEIKIYRYIFRDFVNENHAIYIIYLKITMQTKFTGYS